MTSYKVFITKSSEAAYAIAHGYGCDMSSKMNGVFGVSCGAADGKEIIPGIYHGKGYFYCAAELENMDDSESQKYELIIC